MSGVSMPSMSPDFVRFGDISRCSAVGGQFESRPEHQSNAHIHSGLWVFLMVFGVGVMLERRSKNGYISQEERVVV